MSFFHTKFKKEQRWICSCKRINDKEDEICAYCRQPKPTKKDSGKDPNNARVKSSRTDYNGRWYQSKLEANYAAQLDWRLKAGEIKEWTPQVKLTFKVNGVMICNYYCDFKVVTKDGTVQYHETKGYETEVWRLKKKLMLALLPEIDPGAEYIVIK